MMHQYFGCTNIGLNLVITLVRPMLKNVTSDIAQSWLVLLLYVPSQQLWSLRDGQFT